MNVRKVPRRTLTALTRLNTLRSACDLGEAAEDLAELETYFSQAFRSERKLAVYGTLAPGRVNHHVIAPLKGKWSDELVVYGERLAAGWGAQMGYPAIRYCLSGEEIPVHLFVSRELPEHWPRLDAFEGVEYRRILVPLFRGESFVTVANLYEASK